MAPRVTLDQWRMLLAVVDYGGYAQAAEAMFKSQSSLSYAVTKLQDQLGVKVFSVQGRKAVLTEAGEVLVRRARHLMNEATTIEDIANGLSHGEEALVTLAVDVIFPLDIIMYALNDFAQQYKNTRIELIESVLSGTTEALINGQADMIITHQVPQGFIGNPIYEVELIAVAHKDHPLHQLNRTITTQDLKAHRQIVVRDSGLQKRIDSGWLGAEQRWTVTHMSTSIDAICKGMGFAWLPINKIQSELESSLLIPLNMEEGQRKSATMYFVYADKDEAGPACKRLGELITHTCIPSHQTDCI